MDKDIGRAGENVQSVTYSKQKNSSSELTLSHSLTGYQRLAIFCPRLLLSSINEGSTVLRNVYTYFQATRGHMSKESHLHSLPRLQEPATRPYAKPH
jgi:hypothetical protein